MRIAVISDIHGDLDSLHHVLTAIDRAATEQIWCLGDILGLGATAPAEGGRPRSRSLRTRARRQPRRKSARSSNSIVRSTTPRRAKRSYAAACWSRVGHLQLCEADNAAVVDDHVPVDEVALATGESQVSADLGQETSRRGKAGPLIRRAVRGCSYMPPKERGCFEPVVTTTGGSTTRRVSQLATSRSRVGFGAGPCTRPGAGPTASVPMAPVRVAKKLRTRYVRRGPAGRR